MRVRFGECLLDSETRQLFRGEREVHLQPKAFQFLLLVVENRPKAVAKEQIHEHLWPGTFVSDGTLTSLVAEVRDAIGDEGHEPRFIRTIHRFGYAFSGEAHEAGDTRARPAAGSPAVWIIADRQSVPIAAGESIIGRDPGAAVFVDDKSVSRRHAKIVVSANGATLEDLESKNGTFLRGAKVGPAPVPLADGDRIRVGSVALDVRIFTLPESTETGSGPATRRV